MTPKRIVILDTGKEWGGGTNSLLELLKRVDKKRYAFTALFYDNYRKGADSDVKTELSGLGVGFELLKRGGKSLYIKGMKEAVRPVLFFSPDLKKRSVFYFDYVDRILPDSKRIAAFLRERKAELLYMNNQPSSNLEGILAARMLGIKCVQHSRVDVRLNMVEADAVNSHVAKVICVSRGVMDSLVGSGVRADKCTVVYNGIDSSMRPRSSPEEIRKTLGIKEGSFVIGTVGSLIKRKRVELLIRAAALLKDTGAITVIVGEGPEMKSLKEEARRLGIEGSVMFTGFSSDAISYINAMDAFVLPSEKEGLPRAVLEAMLMGKATVAFDVTGTGELIVNGVTGALLKEGGGPAIASAVRELFKDRSRLSSIGEAGRTRVMKEFSIEKYVKGVEGVFEEVLG